VVRVPATSANLGPGFDAFGLALTLHDVVTARVTRGGLDIKVTGCGAETQSAGEDHLVVRAMRAAFEVIGGQPPGLAISCRNAIPQGFGLGSSAAAIVAGLIAARALSGAALSGAALTGPGVAGAGATNAALTDVGVLGLATELEGHPDNAAACLAGGLTIAWMASSGARSARLAPVAGLAPVVCVPPSGLSTSVARLALPAVVPHADAAQNSARAALLIAALTSDPGLLMDGTEDFLHQRYRAAAMPQATSLIAALRAAGVPAVVSGAGPSVLALTMAGGEPGAVTVSEVAAREEAGWRILPLAADLQGAVAQA
jgi:homoserine kinase